MAPAHLLFRHGCRAQVVREHGRGGEHDAPYRYSGARPDSDARAFKIGYRRPPTVIELQPDYFIFKILKIRCLAHISLIALAGTSSVESERHGNPSYP